VFFIDAICINQSAFFSAAAAAAAAMLQVACCLNRHLLLEVWCPYEA
jgi:hypothetical protein